MGKVIATAAATVADVISGASIAVFI